MGPRTCPGYPLAFLEIKALLAVMTRECGWQVQAPEAVQWARFPIPRPKAGMFARFWSK
jgi:cytochrome P450